MKIKRVYDEPAKSDGYRVLVDRLWPRGLSKERGAIDLWFKSIAPSTELRTWFGHKPERFEEFTARYREELQQNPALSELKELIAKNPDTTLLYGAKNPAINHAVVLRKFILDSSD